jgi:hypothetical protein
MPIENKFIKVISCSFEMFHIEVKDNVYNACGAGIAHLSGSPEFTPGF